MKIRILYERRRLDLAFTWAIARNSSTYKDNFIIGIEADGAVGFGEVAPNIRYGEVPDAIESELIRIAAEVTEASRLEGLFASNSLPHCLHMGLDQAWQHMMANRDGISLSKYLGLDVWNETYPVSFTLPIMEAGQVEGFFHEHGLGRFPYLKVKVGGQGQEGMLAELGRLYTGPVLVDGNEAFTQVSDLDRHVESWQKHVLLAAVEQPFPADRPDLSIQAKGRYPFPILADESAVEGVDMEELAQHFDGINIKMQKCGSYAEAMRQKEAALQLSMKVMVGCMVETTVGIWHGLQLAAGVDFVDLDSFLYVKDEPFAWVKEEAGHLRPASELRPPFYF